MFEALIAELADAFGAMCNSPRARFDMQFWGRMRARTEANNDRFEEMPEVR
ncbi:hypothetical protein GCM10009854_31190 [Saccharopolyspora halophila]|uniref:Uncharacterized protein n=1 Tax=Saccharopolyspora halophila TaxID=405551 RepID=A0ABP5TF30_9PSEU